MPCLSAMLHFVSQGLQAQLLTPMRQGGCESDDESNAYTPAEARLPHASRLGGRQALAAPASIASEVRPFVLALCLVDTCGFQYEILQVRVNMHHTHTAYFHPCLGLSRMSTRM